ncbi:MAG TPA: LD-carboxypeptidase [Polyangiaceae bacterium]|jgi:muramoyltetrapeptide carboxypeptidase
MEAVRAGDVVAVVAPASPFPRAAFLSGLAWVAQRYRVKVREDVFSRAGFLAGEDERRADELAAAMRASEVRAILVARGGYGITRIASRLPWDDFARAPKAIAGFSDVTALHVFAAARGVRCVHGPNVTGLGASGNVHLARNRGAWLAALERPSGSRAWGDLRAIRAGDAAGPIFGGNVALLVAMAAAGKLAIPDGAIVLLEDVTERPYRVDRMLTSLVDGGHLARAAAIVLGEFTQCEAGPDGVTIDAVLAERTRALGVPVYAGAPFGHGARNEAFVIGAQAELRGGTLAW